MQKRKSTSIVLDESLQKTKNELAAVYGLKNLVSAGTLLFSRLSPADQIKAIKDVHELTLNKQPHPDTAKKQKPSKKSPCRPE